MNKISTFMIIIYNETIKFPPTLNAIYCLSKNFDKIIVIQTSGKLSNKWKFPNNVHILESRINTDNLVNSLASFLKFTAKVYTQIKKEQPCSILIYDSMAALAIYLMSAITNNKAIKWYHNHDIVDEKHVSKFSLMRISRIAEKNLFKNLDIFSLPTDERKIFYPMKKLSGKYFTIPNYPGRYFFDNYHCASKEMDSLTLIYQGNISELSGLIEILEYLAYKQKHIGEISEKKIVLRIVGRISREFKNELMMKINKHSLNDMVELISFQPYTKIPKLTSECHVGLATVKPVNIERSTAGTASNKIYEYAALGLPVLYFDSNTLRSALQNYAWAVPTDLTTHSIDAALEFITNNYKEISKQARADFKEKLNFERVFSSPLNYLQTKVCHEN